MDNDISLSWRGRIIQGLVLSQTFTHLERQVQASKIRIRVFEELHNTQALSIMFESSMLLHTFRQHFFAGMSERRMPEIMGESDRLCQIFVQR